jgi:hypothetical protein
MSELTDILIQAVNGNAALVLVLVGLFLSNVWQTKHWDKRFSGIEERVKRAENHLIARADGGHPPEEAEE